MQFGVALRLVALAQVGPAEESAEVHVCVGSVNSWHVQAQLPACVA
jgi:hypothetical protein